MLLNDLQIHRLCNHSDDPMISPFTGYSVRETDGRKRISYGLSSFGYDICLGDSPLIIFPDSHDPLDVKNPTTLAGGVELPPERTDRDTYFVIPPKTKALGVSLERFCMPRDVTALAVGKSTYARMGLNTLVTPLEAGWKGYLTIEIFNLENRPNIVYANEGITQLVFLQGDAPMVSYADRAGKYQDQGNRPTLPIA